MKRVIFFSIILLFAFQNVANAQFDSSAAYSNLKRVKFRLAADVPNSIDNAVKKLYKKQLQQILSEDQFDDYKNVRRCYIASIPLLSITAVCAAWGVFFLVDGIASGIQGGNWNAGFAMELSAVGFLVSIPFSIPGLTLIVNSAKKLNEIADDYNNKRYSSQYQSNLQIQCGFVGNGIGIRLSF